MLFTSNFIVFHLNETFLPGKMGPSWDRCSHDPYTFQTLVDMLATQNLVMFTKDFLVVVVISILVCLLLESRNLKLSESNAGNNSKNAVAESNLFCTQFYQNVHLLTNFPL